MWTATIRGAAGLVIVTFIMWLTATVVQPVVGMATSGPHAGHESVQRVGNYFAALSVDNLVLLGALAVGIFLLGRAAVESRLG